MSRSGLPRATRATPEDDELLTTAQFAAWLKIPEGTARQWRHRHYGPPSFRIGGSVRYRTSEVTRWLARQELAERDRATGAA